MENMFIKLNVIGFYEESKYWDVEDGTHFINSKFIVSFHQLIGRDNVHMGTNVRTSEWIFDDKDDNGGVVHEIDHVRVTETPDQIRKMLNAQKT